MKKKKKPICVKNKRSVMPLTQPKTDLAYLRSEKAKAEQKLHHLIIGQFTRTDQKTFQHSGTGTKTMHTLFPIQLRHLAFKDLLPVLARAQLLLCFGFFDAEIFKFSGLSGRTDR